MRYILAVIFCAITYTTQANTFSYDSIGTENKDGITYILHKVDDGETLYSVSRRYNVPIFKIIESNPPTEFGLEQGQIIRIPLQAIPKAPVQKPIEVKNEIANEKPIESKPLVVKPNEEKTKQNDNKPQQISDFIHIVEQKETLFSISRKYDVKVNQIKEWNGLKGNEISIGQKLIIKKGQNSGTEIKSMLAATDKVHVVQPTETLYGISRTYGVTIEQIKEWNDLIGNEISIGQELVVAKKNTLDEPKTNQPTSLKETVVDTLPEVPKETKETIDTARYTVTPEKRTNFEEVIESGLAEQIEGSEGNRKYLALHKTAKVGTIMKVRNEMNNQEVFVRIIGKLPDTGPNTNVVIKISKAAYERLGAIDPKFRVTVSYIP